MMLRREKGFTLIELMVVILIIAILIAIAVPVFNLAREGAYKRTCQANLRTLESAIQTYNATAEKWPPNINALAPDYVKTVPYCPKARADAAATDTYSFSYPTGTNPPTVLCPGNISGHTLY